MVLNLLVPHLLTHTLDMQNECLNTETHTDAHTPMWARGQSGSHCINLVECLPLLVRHPQPLCRLDGPLHLAGPHLQVRDVLVPDELSQILCKLREHKRDQESM